ncbi:MAG: helix-turn-helix transcriptional regulator [Limisphaerales bacterium]
MSATQTVRSTRLPCGPAPANRKAYSWPRVLEGVGVNAQPSSRVQFWIMLARHARYNVQNLANSPDVSMRQIERYCREELGRSPQEWLNEQRIIAAKMLLLETESVKRVALDLGFKQVSHFCRQFKQAYGVTPSQYLLRQAVLNRNVAHR